MHVCAVHVYFVWVCARMPVHMLVFTCVCTRVPGFVHECIHMCLCSVCGRVRACAICARACGCPCSPGHPSLPGSAQACRLASHGPWRPVSESTLCGPLCRFSHGQVVSVDELRPFQDPDLSSLQAGSACLAKQQDGLWYPARITGEAFQGPP